MADELQAQRPVQVFLDTKRFIDAKEPRDFGGGNRDFFPDNDEGFRVHKASIRTRLQNISASMKKRREPAGFVRVEMREDALAKSYRPLAALFTENSGFALVGAGHIGEMIFQATPQALDRLDQRIEERAELVPRVVQNENTGELEKRVSGYRSETGAIANIAAHDQADRVTFSAEEAVAWFRRPEVVGGYLIELFRPQMAYAPDAIATLYDQLRQSFLRLPSGVRVKPFREGQGPEHFGLPSLAMTVELLTDARQKSIRLPGLQVGRDVPSLPGTVEPAANAPRDLVPAHHQALLSLLSEQTLVRSVDLPPLIEASPAAVASSASRPALAPPVPGVGYPVVGIIDGGVANVVELAPWRAGDAGLVPAADRDENHGTFIAGLVSGGAVLNPHLAPGLESRGCKFFDLDIFPRKDLRQRYFGGDLDAFFDLLDEKIKVAKRQHGVRIFNFSFGMRMPHALFSYTPMADGLDRIARANDVILIVAAGNLPIGQGRSPWSADANDVVRMLATFGGAQQIMPPAEQLLGLTVGAINPPGVRGHEPHMPTTYTRRGPGIGGSRKPDLAHYGGTEPSAGTSNRTGLVSIGPNGEHVENCGTSFAAPHVSACVAGLDHRLEQAQPRELLLALPVHRAARGDALSHKMLRHISREFVGFGVPSSSDATLTDDPHAITLVFNETLHARQVLEFPFSWPAALVTESGGCRGRVDLTLAFTPPIDADHKDEAMRVQLEARLHQEAIDPETGEALWESRLDQDGSGVPQGMNKTERYLLMTGLKWSPLKRYFANMPKGRGRSSNWMLSLDSLTRAGARFPAQGVPFALVMTISDPSRKTAIHDEVRNTLVSQGFRIADITIAHRVRPKP